MYQAYMQQNMSYSIKIVLTMCLDEILYDIITCHLVHFNEYPMSTDLIENNCQKNKNREIVMKYNLLINIPGCPNV